MKNILGLDEFIAELFEQAFKGELFQCYSIYSAKKNGKCKNTLNNFYKACTMLIPKENRNTKK